MLGDRTSFTGIIAVMSSASSVVTYTSVYTDSEQERVFWGADEEWKRIFKKRTKNKVKNDQTKHEMEKTKSNQSQ
ncbi:hypothetical protein Tco_1513116, partial [Tanacetum coccineum]